MKLYECSRGDVVRVVDEDVRVPPAAPTVLRGDVLHFRHIDGMYGMCVDVENIIYYLAAWTEVELVHS